MNKTIYSCQNERVRETLVGLRRKAKLTQRQLAAKLRREHSFVSRFELGERRIDVVELFWICKACGVNPKSVATRLMRDFENLPSE